MLRLCFRARAQCSTNQYVGHFSKFPFSAKIDSPLGTPSSRCTHKHVFAAWTIHTSVTSYNLNFPAKSYVLPHAIFRWCFQARAHCSAYPYVGHFSTFEFPANIYVSPRAPSSRCTHKHVFAARTIHTPVTSRNLNFPAKSYVLPHAILRLCSQARAHCSAYPYFGHFSTFKFPANIYVPPRAPSSCCTRKHLFASWPIDASITSQNSNFPPDAMSEHAPHLADALKSTCLLLGQRRPFLKIWIPRPGLKPATRAI